MRRWCRNSTHFKVRRNVIFKRARFNQRNQGAGESAEAYIMELYRLAENCSYGELKDEMIRDRLVVGIRGSALSQRLQLDAGLTLEKAKKNVRQRGAVGEQQQVLRGPTDADPSLNELHRQRRDTRWKGTSSRYKKSFNRTMAPQTIPCGRCGKEPHPREKCPAKDQMCHVPKEGSFRGDVS